MSGTQHGGNFPQSSNLAESILANQAREIELRKQAEENKKQSIKYNYDLAKQSIQAQLEDRREQRAHQKVLWNWIMWFCFFITLIASCFLCWALYLNKENFLLEIVRILFYGGSGFCAGFSLHKVKKNDSELPQE